MRLVVLVVCMISARTVSERWGDRSFIEMTRTTKGEESFEAHIFITTRYKTDYLIPVFFSTYLPLTRDKDPDRTDPHADARPKVLKSFFLSLSTVSTLPCLSLSYPFQPAAPLHPTV